MSAQFTPKELDLIYDALFWAMEHARDVETYLKHSGDVVLLRKAMDEGAQVEILRAKVNGLRNEHLSG